MKIVTFARKLLKMSGTYGIFKSANTERSRNTCIVIKNTTTLIQGFIDTAPNITTIIQRGFIDTAPAANLREALPKLKYAEFDQNVLNSMLRGLSN